jgi:HB1, ASXL, restriction endonuclease HTH domain
MPDQYGFNHLGDEVRCIDCPSGGPLWQWPEHKRARHGRSHGHAPKAVSPDLRRQRSLLTAPPTTSNEEKEATMATTATGKGDSAKQVAIDVLRRAGQPLHASEIAKRVLASGRCAGLKGKTPEATISAMLAVGSKPGGPFTRIDKGTYALADSAGSASKAAEAESPSTAKPATTAKRPRPAARKSAAAKSKAAAKRSPTKRTAAKRAR